MNFRNSELVKIAALSWSMSFGCQFSNVLFLIRNRISSCFWPAPIGDGIGIGTYSCLYAFLGLQGATNYRLEKSSKLLERAFPSLDGIANAA